MFEISKKNYKKNIDGLRAISVLAVIIFHLDSKFLPGGFMGVDIFFVISGYLISKLILDQLENNTFKLSNFFFSRARRILPILLLTFIIFFPLSFFLLPSKIISIAQSILSSIFFISNIFFYYESGYFGEAVALKPFIHLWSLSVEEQFYLFFPIFCIIFYKKKLFLPILFLIFFASLLVSINFSNSHPNANFFLTPTRVWEIIAGIIFVFFEKKNFIIKKNLIEFLCVASLFTIFLSLFILNGEDKIPNLKLLPLVLSIGILITLGEKSDISNKILTNIKLRFIGIISYSLYMLHQPMLALNKNYELFEENIGFKLLFLIISIILSFITWKYIEQPFRNSKFISNKSFIYIILSGLIFVISLCLITLKENGFIERFSKNDQYLALLNTKTQGRYVQQKFNSLKNENFLKLDDKNLIIFGDSHAMDFVNTAFENNYFKNYNVKTVSFSIECYLKFLDEINFKQRQISKKCLDEIPKDLNFAKNVFFVNVWENWIIEDLKKIQISQLLKNKDIYILGTKSFGNININNLIKLSIEDRKNYIFRLDKKWVETQRLFIKNLTLSTYIDPYVHYCDEKFNCKIFTDKNKLISYDGSHLTQDGARYFGSKLFNVNKLKKFKKF